MAGVLQVLALRSCGGEHEARSYIRGRVHCWDIFSRTINFSQSRTGRLDGASIYASMYPTPLTLLYKYEVVRSGVELRELEPDAARFDVAAAARPQDAMLSVAIVPGMIRIELHEPERLVLDTRLDLERRLPPIVIAVRHDAHVEPIRLLGSDWGDRLQAPLWVRRSGTPTDLLVAIGAAMSASPPREQDYCELSWSVNSRPRSLRFAAAGARTQLILRPSRCD
jgi:hypothetical protein